MSVSRDHYYALASEIDSERIAAATKLLSELGKADIAEEWDYALNRLIKGLTTSRQSARFGFSMALTELVRELVASNTHSLTVSLFLDRVIESSVVSASMKGKEVRSTLFGRLFGLQALVNSQLLFEREHSSQETLEKFAKLLVELSSAKPWLRETAMYTLCQFVGAYLQSPFAEDETTTFFLQTISDEGLTFTTEGLAVMLTIPASSRARVAAGVSSTRQWKHGDPMVRGNLPVLAKVLKDVDAEDPTAAENGSDAANDAETSEKNTEKTAEKGKEKGKQVKQKGTWSPRLPFVWDLLVQHFVASESAAAEDASDESGDSSSKKRKKHAAGSKKRAKIDAAPVEYIPFREFWKVAVDDTLFADKSSAERKYWGFEIFNKFLAALPPHMVTHLFTPNLMRCLINQSAQSGRLLNKISTKTINTIIETTQADLAKVVPCLNAVTDDARGGSWKIDQLTKSKLCDALVGVLSYIENPESVDFGSLERVVHEITHALIAKFEAAVHYQKDIEDSKKKSNDALLKWVLDKLLVVFRSTKRYKASFIGAMEAGFKFLIQHAFFRAKGDSSVALSETVFKLVQDRLNSFLAEFIASRRKDHSWSLYCVKQIEKFEKRGELELVLELSDELGEIRDECFLMLDTIKQAMKQRPSAQKDQYCFELLFSMNLLQLYMGETETVSVLEDLKASYSDIFGGNDDDIDTAVVLTEIILSFVSRKSTLLKKLSAIVWESYMCAEDAEGQLHINENCFKLLFDVLDSSENEEGQKRLFEGEAEYRGDEEMENSGSESHEGGSDKDSANSGSDSDSDSGSGSGSDSDSDSDADSGSDTSAGGAKTVEMVEKETKIKLANALGIKGDYDGEVKFEDIDSEDDDQYESESMDDEQMMAIDGELARIFKERRSALTENSTSKKNSEKVMAKEQMLLFKNRVLDLLESFAKVQPNSIYNVSFLRPLVNLINTTKDKNLGVKAHKLLKTRISKVKFSAAEFAKVYTEAKDIAKFKKSLLELVEWLQFQAGAYSSSQSHGAACAQSCIIASKCLLVADADSLSEIIQIYAATLTKWATEPKNRIQAGLFFDFVNWLSTKRTSGSGN